jgi:3-deoxy-D-manno-octulosonic-acid transferase
MLALYDRLLGLAALAIAPLVALPRFRAHRERLGRYPEELLARLRGRRVLWLHNASVGELMAARPLLHRMREALPQWRIVLSTTSLSGRALARDLAESDGAVLLPLDTSACVERALDALRPSLFVFTETEIWPTLLLALERRNVPALLLSGRVSPRAFRRYRWISPLLRRSLGAVALFGMQSEEESERIRDLGAPADRVRTTGNLKLDGVVAPRPIAVEVDGPLWIAASTHAGEEEACARVLARLRRRFPKLRLLLAPRHLERRAAVEAALEGLGVSYARRSELPAPCWRGETEVLLLDTLGELSGLYGGAVAAFVGGTLVSVGGHNLMEPARAGVAVLFGPHVENVAAVARELEAAGGGALVRDEVELEARLGALVADPGLSRRMGQAALAACKGGGAVETSLRAVVDFLPRGGGE